MLRDTHRNVKRTKRFEKMENRLFNTRIKNERPNEMGKKILLSNCPNLFVYFCLHVRDAKGSSHVVCFKGKEIGIFEQMSSFCVCFLIDFFINHACIEEIRENEYIQKNSKILCSVNFLTPPRYFHSLNKKF